MSLFESRIARIRTDAAEIESAAMTIAELRKLNPFSTPIADLRGSARALRNAAQKLDDIASKGAE